MSKIEISLENTNELRKLMLNNPELPLLIFAGSEAYNDEFAYSMADVRCVEIKELTVYKNCYIEKDEYEEQLIDDLSEEEEYYDLSDSEYFKMIGKKVEEAEYTKAIVIYVG